ncbi:hypothetical protein L6R53_20850 [Myxococcota bacterium]|nr:hypothetical protein [Myxococcota bacterium]
MKRGPGAEGEKLRRGPPGRRPGGGGGNPARREFDRKVDELVRDAGIPKPWALQVARGQVTLNEVLQRLARADRVEQLVHRHGLDRALATQVASGTLELEAVLRRLRLEAHLAEHRDHDSLARAVVDGAPRTLHLHGLRRIEARIRAVDAYEVEVDGAEGPTRLHKLQVKLLHAPDAKVKVGAAAGRAAAEPIKRPQDRYPCSDKRLFAALDAGQEVRIQTLEGDVLSGQITRVSRWEVALRQKGGGELVVFRHAIADLKEG